jgi:GNAT superfamily N-acetyltransferase
MMGGVSWRIRAFAAAADRAWVRLLWQAAMPPSWPVLPAGIGQLDDGLVAQAGHVRVGFAALDAAGSIPLILVEPVYQRRGIGTGLLDAALRQLRGQRDRRQRRRRVHLAGSAPRPARRGQLLRRARLAAHP